jgi:hypothetical protein
VGLVTQGLVMLVTLAPVLVELEPFEWGLL